MLNNSKNHFFKKFLILSLILTFAFSIFTCCIGKLTVNAESGSTTGKIEITKTDSKDNSIKLKDAEFSLLDSSGKLIENATTDKNGKAVFTVPLGDYDVIETKAPDGYELDTNKHHVTLSSSVNYTNLGTANDFNFFILGDLSQSNDDVEGRAAIMGNATLTNFGIGSTLSTSTTRSDLIIGGDVNVTSGTNSGNTEISESSKIIKYSMTNTNNIKNPIRGHSINFSDAKAYLEKASSDWSAIKENGSVINNYGQLILEGKDKNLNIFDIKDGTLSDKTNQIEIDVPRDSTVIINVSGKNISIGNCSITDINNKAISGTDGRKFLWNFYEASTINWGGLSIKGSVLAPFADWKCLSCGNIEGTLIVKNLVSQDNHVEGHNYIFNGNLPMTHTNVPVVSLYISDVKKITPPTTQLRNIKIVKKGEVFTKFIQNAGNYNTVPLNGIKFSIFDESDVVNGTIKNNAKAKAILVTDENGTACSKLDIGKYVIIEDTPYIYVNSNPIYFEINSNTPVDKTIEFDLTNTLKKQDIEFIKKDSTNGNTLSGCTIDIMDSNNNIIYEGTTDINGKIDIKNMPYGKYKYKEKTSPIGYNLDSNIYNLDIYGGNIIYLTLKDTAIVPPGPTPPKPPTPPVPTPPQPPMPTPPIPAPPKPSVPTPSIPTPPQPQLPASKIVTSPVKSVSTVKLVQTGYAADFKLLVCIGGLLSAIGVVLLIKIKKH